MLHQSGFQRCRRSMGLKGALNTAFKGTQYGGKSVAELSSDTASIVAAIGAADPQACCADRLPPGGYRPCRDMPKVAAICCPNRPPVATSDISAPLTCSTKTSTMRWPPFARALVRVCAAANLSTMLVTTPPPPPLLRRRAALLPARWQADTEIRPAAADHAARPMGAGQRHQQDPARAADQRHDPRRSVGQHGLNPAASATAEQRHDRTGPGLAHRAGPAATHPQRESVPARVGTKPWHLSRANRPARAPALPSQSTRAPGLQLRQQGIAAIAPEPAIARARGCVGGKHRAKHRAGRWVEQVPEGSHIIGGVAQTRTAPVDHRAWSAIRQQDIGAMQIAVQPAGLAVMAGQGQPCIPERRPFRRVALVSDLHDHLANERVTVGQGPTPSCWRIVSRQAGINDPKPADKVGKVLGQGGLIAGRGSQRVRPGQPLRCRPAIRIGQIRRPHPQSGMVIGIDTRGARTGSQRASLAIRSAADGVRGKRRHSVSSSRYSTLSVPAEATGRTGKAAGSGICAASKAVVRSRYTG